VKFLISAFEPFDKQPENSSLLILQALTKLIPDLHTAILPVEFERCWEVLKPVVEQTQPEWVICMGQAETRDNASVERVALNWLDARVADNRGFQPVDKPIVKGAPEALFSSAPAREIAEILSSNGAPTEVSYFAGTYVCNDLYFHVLEDSIAKDYHATFIHWPLLQEQKVSGGMRPGTLNADTCAQALSKVISSL